MSDCDTFRHLEEQFLVASQVAAKMQKDLMMANQSPILQGFAAAIATFLCFTTLDMEILAAQTLQMASDMNIEQDFVRSMVIDLQPFFKSHFSFGQLERVFDCRNIYK